jgi:hypothetical protein
MVGPQRSPLALAGAPWALEMEYEAPHESEGVGGHVGGGEWDENRWAVRQWWPKDQQLLRLILLVVSGHLKHFEPPSQLDKIAISEGLFKTRCQDCLPVPSFSSSESECARFRTGKFSAFLMLLVNSMGTAKRIPY